MKSPYPGLRAFRQAEADIFFGREEQVEQLLQKLEQSRFVAVVGVSGCGKSSLVRAGLLSELSMGFPINGRYQWRIATMHPGDHPIQNLTNALLEHSALGEERIDLSYSENLAFLLATLSRGSLGLIEVLEETPLPEKTNLLILVDQFEEIFRQSVKCDVNEAIAFVSLLLASVERQSQVFVVLTMRSDFLGDCPVFLGLPEAINDSQFLTPRLTRDQCRAAIQGPAAVFGSTVEPRLVNHLLNKMGDHPDKLPVLQHCLMRMWQKALERNGKKEEDVPLANMTKTNQGIEITSQDYEDVGELQNAISRHGEEAIKEVKKLGDHAERTTEYLFRALVDVVSERRDMRRVASLDQIASETTISKEQLKKIAETFCDPRFCFIQIQQGKELTFESKLYIAHESLIWQWNHLNQWADQEAESAETYRHLEHTARMWKKGEHKLLDRLAFNKYWDWWMQETPNAEWAKRYGSDFSLTEEFLYASRTPELYEIPDGGALPEDSPIYIARPADEEVLIAITRSRAVVTIRGPRQTGKTSLIMQVYAAMKEQLRFVFIDFQALPHEEFQSLNTIWQTIAVHIADQLRLDDWDSTSWKPGGNYDRYFSRFLDRFVFDKNDSPLLLCFDEVDRVFKFPVKSEFFASVRAFYNRGAFDPAWKKVRWLLATSSEPSFFIEDLTQSPFNIGLRVELNTFTSEEVDRFARRHGLTLESDTIPDIMDYVGGHPYLVHLLLYQLVRNPDSRDQLFKTEYASRNIFRDHLNRFLMQFQQEKELAEAIKSVIAEKCCDDVRMANRLEAAGLVRRDENQKIIPLCRLYAEFFGKEL